MIKRQGYQTPSTGGRVGVITAGTSDVPVAEEARIVAAEMGCETFAVYDVGWPAFTACSGRCSRCSASLKWMCWSWPREWMAPYHQWLPGWSTCQSLGLPTAVGYGIGGKGLGRPHFDAPDLLSWTDSGEHQITVLEPAHRPH